MCAQPEARSETVDRVKRNGNARESRAKRGRGRRGRGVNREQGNFTVQQTSAKCGKIIAISVGARGTGEGGVLARLRAVSFARKGGRDGDSEIQLKILRVTRRENVQLPFKGLRDRSIQPPCVLRTRIHVCACVCAFEAAKTKGEVRVCCTH
jgi:hypothetical protein